MNSFVLNPSLFAGALGLAAGVGLPGALAALAATMAFGERAELWALTGVEAAALGAGGDLALTAFPGVVFATGLGSLEAGVEGVVTSRARGGVACAAADEGATGTVRVGATTGFSCVLAIAPSCAVVFVRLVSPVAPVRASIDVCLRIASALDDLAAALEALVLRRRAAAGFAAADALRVVLAEPASADLLADELRAGELLRAALVRARAAADFLTFSAVPVLLALFFALVLAEPVFPALALATLLSEAALAALPDARRFEPAVPLLVVFTVDSSRAAAPEPVRFAVDRTDFVPPDALLDADAFRLFAVFLFAGIRGVLLSLSRFGDGTEASWPRGATEPLARTAPYNRAYFGWRTPDVTLLPTSEGESALPVRFSTWAATPSLPALSAMKKQRSRHSRPKSVR